MQDPKGPGWEVTFTKDTVSVLYCMCVVITCYKSIYVYLAWLEGYTVCIWHCLLCV